MGDSSIEWTDATWNPVRGCSRISPGCQNCYAESFAARFGEVEGHPFEGYARMVDRDARWTGRVELIPSKLDEPLHWRKPQRVFVNSMSDLFHDALPDEAIDSVFAVMALAPQHTFQILTKRPERMLRYTTSAGKLDGVASRVASLAQQAWGRRETPDAIRVYPLGPILADGRPEFGYRWLTPWPLTNVWLGVSVEDQATADERIPLLLQTPAAKRFVSYEPALEGVSFRAITGLSRIGVFSNRGFVDALTGETEHPESRARGGAHLAPMLSALDWIIVGGESGPGARPFDVAWARTTVEQCKAAGVAVFVKQMGSNVRDRNDRFATETLAQEEHQGAPVRIRLKSKKGGDPAEWPESLRVREFPS